MSRSTQAETSPLTLAIEPAAGTITLLDAEQRLGWAGLQFYLRNGTRELMSRGLERQDRPDGTTVCAGALEKQITVELVIAPSPTGRGWTITPRLANHSQTELHFTGYGFRPAAGQPGIRYQPPQGGLPVFAHTDNLRYEYRPHCCVQYPFLRPLPIPARHLGVQPQGPMPLLVLGQTESDRWLIEGALTQQRHLISWHLGLASHQDEWADCRSEFTWMGGVEEILRPGEQVELETILFLLVRAAPDRLYAAYLEELTTRHAFVGPGSTLDREPVFCTWNFSVFTNITEADCLTRMDLVAALQRGGWFQLDHGYQPPSPSDGKANGHLDVYYPNGQRAWDVSRFPAGPKGFVAACRQRGLRPAIWWTPRVELDGVIQREHPEWLLLDKRGAPINDVGHVMLDCSVPAARAFMEHCAELMIREWGFEGIKIDFFSWMFDHPEIKFRQGGTGVVWKRWLLQMIRSRLGPHGYFLHGVSCPMGNPFLAIDGLDSFRAGIDIDRGTWAQHINNCSWLLPAILATGKATWFANLDSCMGAPEIPAVERRSRNAFAYVSAGMLEFSGPIEKLDAAALAEYRRLVERCDQGGPVSCPDRAAFWGRALPRVLVRSHAPDSRTRERFQALMTIGFFNWTDADQLTTLDLSTLGLDPQRIGLRDFWTGAAQPLTGSMLATTLPARSHGLWDVLPR